MSPACNLTKGKLTAQITLKYGLDQGNITLVYGHTINLYHSPKKHQLKKNILTFNFSFREKINYGNKTILLIPLF